MVVVCVDCLWWLYVWIVCGGSLSGLFLVVVCLNCLWW